MNDICSGDFAPPCIGISIVILPSDRAPPHTPTRGVYHRLFPASQYLINYLEQAGYLMCICSHREAISCLVSPIDFGEIRMSIEEDGDAVRPSESARLIVARPLGCDSSRETAGPRSRPAASMRAVSPPGGHCKPVDAPASISL